MHNRVSRAIVLALVGAATVSILQVYPSLLFLENPAVGAGNYVNIPGAGLGLATGEAAPDFTIMTLDAQTMRLAELRGKVVVLDFMATWCIPCQQQMPHLARIYEKYKDRGLVLISIDADPKETYQELASFRSKYAAQWPFALDKGEVTSAYRVSYIPMTFLIDREGVIRFKHLGFIGEAALGAEVEKYL